MKSKIFTLAGLLLLLLVSSTALASETSPEGDWWIVLQKGDKGRMFVKFSDLNDGTFKVEGNGYLYNKAATFINIPSDQQLYLDYMGQITGVLDLQDDSGISVGSLNIDGGKINNKFEAFNLTAELTVNLEPPVAVALKGSRMPTSTTIYTGRTVSGAVNGKNLKSKYYDLTVSEGTLAFPFFSLNGGGSVSVDGVPTQITLTGTLLRDPFNPNKTGMNSVGSFTSPELGDGSMTGSLSVSKSSNARKVNLKLVTADRSFKLSGTLDIAVSPVISVSPTTNPYDYGTVTAGQWKDVTFTVTNTGTGVLNGEITLEGDGFHNYSNIYSYSLEEDEKTTIIIRFQPGAAGTYSGTIKFTGGGGTSRTITGTGKAAQ